MLFKNIFNICEARRINVFDYVPLTFILETGSEYYQNTLDKFTGAYNAIQKAIERESELNKKEEYERDHCKSQI